MTKIKICGLSRECDIDYVNELKPDYIGYVFWQRSRRRISREQAALFTARLSKSIVPVGVFVDAEAMLVASMLNDGIIGAAQLHGHEDEHYAERLRALTDKPIIKAFKVERREDIDRANDFPADYVLLDNGYGTGRTFDWSHIADMSRPFFLAGGLNAANVADAVTSMQPYAIDVSSGVETGGHKDYDKIREFIDKVRKAECN